MSDIKPTISFGGFSSDRTRPDYAHPLYREQVAGWQQVDDVREGTGPMREKRSDYLPKFEAETDPEWAKRVLMTYASDTYELTLEEHVGLVMGEPMALSEDVPPQIVDLAPDINGEGDSLDVFASDALDSAMHFGHGVLWGDYPDTAGFKNNQEKLRAKVRPFAVWWPAPQVLDWRTVSVGGVKCVTMIKFRENTDREAGGEWVPCLRYRTIWQDVTTDPVTGRALSLGRIQWKAVDIVAGADGTKEEIIDAGGGFIDGPTKIPAHVIYGGRKKGFMHSSPHLKGIATTSVEEFQVTSDYAWVMHKCNVPTPIFIGRKKGVGEDAVVMGKGIDIPMGGDAKMLEPAGTAIGATETRLGNLAHRMQRQGATTSDGGRVLTATEAAQVAKSKTAKLRKSAGSLESGIEGLFTSFAEFMKIALNAEGKAGKAAISRDFAGVQIDPAYLGVLVQAFVAEGLSIEPLMYALKNGRLPDDFDATDETIRMMTEAVAKADAEAAAEAARLEAEKEIAAAGGGDDDDEGDEFGGDE